MNITKEDLTRELDYYNPLREQAANMGKPEKAVFLKMIKELSEEQLRALMRFSECRFWDGIASSRNKIVEKFSRFVNSY